MDSQQNKGNNRFGMALIGLKEQVLLTTSKIKEIMNILRFLMVELQRFLEFYRLLVK